MTPDFLWKTKLAARIHDPAEKALVLLRDPAGHEGGTSRAIARLLGLDSRPGTETIDPDNDAVLSRVFFRHGLEADVYRHVQRADWWAAAADRPQWPMEELTLPNGRTLKVADWAQVRWSSAPVLVHPLTGTRFDLGKFGGLGDVEISDIKQRSFKHFAGLLEALGMTEGEQDLRRILLTFWRFGPELTEEEDNGKLGALWRLLPADTRVPDHSIWDHLDLTSAFAGAFAADTADDAALLSVSLGPVQSFIAAARSTSDLWAGSHLLSRLAWEAMRPVCEQLGPDAILFPRLRGVPQVDLWLRDAMKLPASLFQQCEWLKGATDSNPLFSAALPNRFVAVVPAGEAAAIAAKVERAARDWLQGLGRQVVDELLHAVGEAQDESLPCYAQMVEQLDGFPEVHWSAVPFSLATPRDPERQTNLDTARLAAAMAPFFGTESHEPSGFLASPAWRVLQGGGGSNRFFAPNPGVLYPAVYDLGERVVTAAKALRPFRQQRHSGWRCSLTGEAEWLTTDRSQLGKSYRQQTDTLWARLAERKPSWARPGEHLGALPAIKRLWPELFAREVGSATGTRDIGRFVVSTHTMSLAHQLEQWLASGGQIAENLADEISSASPVALPRKLVREHARNRALEQARRLPGLLDAGDEREDEDGDKARRKVQQALGVDRLETYYALLLLDGDRMGQMLSGDPKWAITYRESFHPHVQAGFDRCAATEPGLREYAAQKRALSPNRHLAISGALNDFSLTVVRHVVEVEHLGRVIYAGGDDVLAMLPVADALSAAQRLRAAYSGSGPGFVTGLGTGGLALNNGFALLDGRLMRMMGTGATASCGVVFAHHQAPLAAVRRALDAAEKRAKHEGGRDALSLTVIKRSGGALNLTTKWGEPLAVLQQLRDFLRDDEVSRRAAYNTLQWLGDLPEPAGEDTMLADLLAYQMTRQAEAPARKRHDVSELARRLTALALQEKSRRLEWLGNFISVAEFLARELRNGARA